MKAVEKTLAMLALPRRSYYVICSSERWRPCPWRRSIWNGLRSELARLLLLLDEGLLKGRFQQLQKPASTAAQQSPAVVARDANIIPEEMCEYAQVHLRFMPPKAAKTDNS